MKLLSPAAGCGIQLIYTGEQYWKAARSYHITAQHGMLEELKSVILFLSRRTSVHYGPPVPPTVKLIIIF